MRENLMIHLEPDGTGLPTWWAESKELEGFTEVAAASCEFREPIREGLTIISEEAGCSMAMSCLAGCDKTPPLAEGAGTCAVAMATLHL